MMIIKITNAAKLMRVNVANGSFKGNEKRCGISGKGRIKWFAERNM